MESKTATTHEGPRDLAALVRRAAAMWPDKEAWLFPASGEALTFAEIDRTSNGIAAFLQRAGVRVGDRVAVMLPNIAHFPLTWLAIAKVGAIMVPLNIHYRSRDAGFILEHSEPKIVVTSSDHLTQILAASRHLGYTVVVIDEPEDPRVAVRMVADDRNFQERSTYQPHAETAVNIQYTSGTTGHPKGCVLTHGYWTLLADLFVHAKGILGVSSMDVMLTAQPFYYIDPQWNVAVSLLSGARLVILDRFHPATFWRDVRGFGVTWFYCLGVMPTLLLRMPRGPDDRDHSVRVILSSGIPTSLHHLLEERWGVPWFEVYGLTETGMDIRVSPSEHHELVGSGCIGRPLPHRDVRVVDDTDTVVERGTQGELVLRGTGLMEQYFRDQAATADTFRGGWFHTGDIVRMDQDGLIYFVGRKKEFIRRSGENVSAAEVEDVLKSHAAIEMAAVVPVPDELRGEEVGAFVVLRKGQEELEARAIAEFCRERLAYFKVPRYWIFCDDLPRTPSERIAKQRLFDPPYSNLPVHDVLSVGA